MAKKQKNNVIGSTVGDNPLAAARSGKMKQKLLSTTMTTTPAASSSNNDSDDTKKNKKKTDESTTSSRGTGADEIAEFDTKRKQNKNERTNFAANTKAEQIWHRRSGAGYNIFVEYYLKQPNGIVVAIDDESSFKEEKKEDGDDNNVDDVVVLMVGEKKDETTTVAAVVATGGGGGAGLSRAALRRKKKKRKRNPVDSSESLGENVPLVEECQEQVEQQHIPITAVAAAVVATISKDRLLYKGRLLEVLATASSSSSSSKQKPKQKQKSNNKKFHDFLLSLSKPLPLTFRFRKTNNNQKKQLINELRERLHDKTSDYIKANVKPVVFDPQHIYQAMPSAATADPNKVEFAIDKNSLKSICPTMKEFLMRYTKNGIIARQELGSMLPVWILDKVGAFAKHENQNKILRVLDMCSSPGSKTLQVIEEFGLLRTGGRVRANDVNITRLDSLKDAIGRSGLLGDDYNDDGNEDIIKYSNVDASKYPIPKNGYNIILCDVPCSGDGTCRKDLHIIKNWLPSIGNALHSLQKSILIRALQCIALDGYVCYSTCSLNPIEDEAVVYGALNEINQISSKQSSKSKSKQQNLSLEFELIHVSKELLNGLILHPGVSTWNVADYNYGDSNNNDKDDNDNANETEEEEEEERVPKLCWYDSYESATTTTNDENNDDKIIMNDAVRSMWPPSPTTATAGDSPSPSPTTSNNANTNINNKTIPLNHCLRLFPQDQDTGGFFVTIIKRIK
jgi:16S rRNA C967 or C1407 C5-methylase (RsmB/RsmF family)